MPREKVFYENLPSRRRQVPGTGRGLVPRRGPEPVPDPVTREPVDRCPRSFQERDLGTADGARRVRRTVGVLVTLDLDGAAGPGR
ncbi:hypothetical protein [Streptomyces sp. F-1]|uniref:hypothetical protein n=1 Tax=Streptomyces sp. F-1 TaxID=463642 RepID=UPI00085C2FDC|nr:hypothetical protein [Streptomyces sp. F-1]SFY50096.1 hypothetical protein STEPF1_03342 [Streptomyces sp. F-1]